MAYHSLADFLEALGQAGELVRMEAPVEPELEAAEAASRTVKSGGPAAIFPNVAGHDIPLLVNLLGTQSRVLRALGRKSLDEMAVEVEEWMHPPSPEGWFDKMQLAPPLAALRKAAPKSVTTAACQQVVCLGRDVDLAALPALQSAPRESGRTITAGQLFAREPGSSRRWVGRCDMRLVDRHCLAACWHPHDEPARFLLDYARRKERMPLALVLGGDPACLLAAMAPVPPGADVCALAGLFRRKPVELVKCRTSDLEVPADAEMVLEGYVDPGEPLVDAGLVATPSGSCRPCPASPQMHVTALTHRANPIFPAMVPCEPPNEACVVHRVLVRAFLPLLRAAIPELVDCDLPMFGATRHWALVSIRKTYAGQAHRVASALQAMRPWMYAKVLVIVDDGVDVRDPDQVWSAVARHADLGRDLISARGPSDPWDPAAPPEPTTCRLAIDATKKKDEG